jgi:hypothetical protein
MLLSDMETALKRYGFDATDPLDTWINAGMHDFERTAKWTFLDIAGTINTVAGTSDYAYPNVKPNYLRINGDSDPLKYYPLTTFTNKIPDRTSQGHPYCYTMIGKQVRLYYVPDGVYTIETMGRAAEPDLNGPNSTPTFIPSDLHYLIVLNAAIIAFNAEDEQDRANAIQAEYGGMLGNALSVYTDHTDGPRFVQDAYNVFHQ